MIISNDHPTSNLRVLFRDTKVMYSDEMPCSEMVLGPQCSFKLDGQLLEAKLTDNPLPLSPHGTETSRYSCRTPGVNISNVPQG